MKAIIEIVASLVMGIGLMGILIERCRSKRGIGIRAIQFVAIVFLVPTILILGLENVLGPETIATLLGAAIGYTLSGIGRNESDANA